MDPASIDVGNAMGGPPANDHDNDDHYEHDKDNDRLAEEAIMTEDAMKDLILETCPHNLEGKKCRPGYNCEHKYRCCPDFNREDPVSIEHPMHSRSVTKLRPRHVLILALSMIISFTFVRRASQFGRGSVGRPPRESSVPSAMTLWDLA